MNSGSGFLVNNGSFEKDGSSESQAEPEYIEKDPTGRYIRVYAHINYSCTRF